MDYLVIGAGWAGAQLGSFLRRAGRDYLILEAGRAPGPGGGRRTLNIRYETRATRIARDASEHDASEHFAVMDQRGQVYRARRLIVATGLSRPYVPPIVHLGFGQAITGTGRRPDRLDSTIFDKSCRPELTAGGRFPALTSEWESVNVPDLYFAGTLARVREDEARDAQPAAGAVRFDIRALQRMLDCKYEGAEWPHRELPADPAAMAGAVLARINRSPALVQQYAVLCDLIVAPHVLVEPGGAAVRYYEELPVDYVHDSMIGSADCYFMITLEYGDGGWVGADPGRGDRYLRPVIRRYRRWSLISVQRLPEDIGNDWTGDKEFHQPLCAYFGRQMVFAVV